MSNELTRRRFLGTAAVAAVGLPVVLRSGYPVFAAGTGYVPPASPREKLNFNFDWKFIRQDVGGAEAPAFDDSSWTTVSTPHSFNDVDSFRKIIVHSGGDVGTYKGLSWYRKHFKLPAETAGRKVFIEFEGMRQAGDIYLNGKQVGLYENGINAYGIDITDALAAGGAGEHPRGEGGQHHELQGARVLRGESEERRRHRLRAVGFEWNANDFNPDHGGINRQVWLHVTGKIHQTLPLYYGLESQGVYVHAGELQHREEDSRCDRGCRGAQWLRRPRDGGAVRGHRRPLGQVRAQFDGDPVDMVDGEKSVHDRHRTHSRMRASGARTIPICTTSTPC